MQVGEREGADITANDMIVPEQEPSEIVEFFNNSTVLITGATGYLGKICMEKLLRVCPGINKIYVLVRAKKGKEAHKRLEDLFSNPEFEPLYRKQPQVFQKVCLMHADLTLPDLGLSEESQEILKQEVNCIFHFAATVRFDEKLRTAVNINVRSVRDLISLAKKMKNLKSFINVSTAYSNCVYKKIDEKFYDVPISPDNLITLVECLDEDKLTQITPILLGNYPNTYVFTKAIAEQVIRNEGNNLPIALFRPSIVIASLKEPVAGFIDNVYGATGVLLGAAVGLLRTLHCDRNKHADMVPADYVVNSCIATAWEVAKAKTLNENKETQVAGSCEEKFEKEVPVYNFVSTPERPLTWGMFQKLGQKHAPQVPSELCIWHYFFFLLKNRVHHQIAVFLLHTLPAYIVDFIALCIGKKPLLVKGYQKLNKFAAVIAYFATQEWEFKNDNVQALWQRLNKTDKELFEFSMKLLNWDSYFYTYVRGARIYLLKDPLETIPKGKDRKSVV